jgi:hypothetical protein
VWKDFSLSSLHSGIDIMIWKLRREQNLWEGNSGTPPLTQNQIIAAHSEKNLKSVLKLTIAMKSNPLNDWLVWLHPCINSLMVEEACLILGWYPVCLSVYCFSE